METSFRPVKVRKKKKAFENNNIINKVGILKSDMEICEFFHSVREKLARICHTLGVDKLNVVTYGLGKFVDCVIARNQLAFVLALRECDVINKSPVDVYDPLFSEDEVSVLQSLGFNVILRNEEACRSVDSPTLFFMPHCGKALYNNLLWSNWNPENLKNVLIIGNSFENMRTNNSTEMLENQYSYIARIHNWTRECDIENSYKFTDVFNDLALHFFEYDRLNCPDWRDNAKPVYDKSSVEIILNK